MIEIAGGILLALFVLLLLLSAVGCAGERAGKGRRWPPPPTPPVWERPDLRSDWQKRKDAAAKGLQQ